MGVDVYMDSASSQVWAIEYSKDAEILADIESCLANQPINVVN